MAQLFVNIFVSTLPRPTENMTQICVYSILFSCGKVCTFIWFQVFIFTINNFRTYLLNTLWELNRYYHCRGDIEIMVMRSDFTTIIRASPLVAVWCYNQDTRVSRGCPRGVMVKAMDCSRAITFTFGQIPLGKVWTPLSSQLWVK